MRSISASLIAGMTGATITEVGTPAPASRRSASRRRAGVAARGSITRASLGSSVVTESATLTRPCARHARQDVEIAQHQRRFGDDADRMAGSARALRGCARMTRYAPFDRLIGIGVGADRDGASAHSPGRQFALQQLRRLRLDEQLRFEIEPGRKPEIGVGRSREAIDAAVLAAAIGIDRAVEGRYPASRCG